MPKPASDAVVDAPPPGDGAPATEDQQVPSLEDRLGTAWEGPPAEGGEAAAPEAGAVPAAAASKPATAPAAKPAEAKPQTPLTPQQITEQTQALETRTQELQEYESHLSQVYEEVRGILANPKFQEAYRQIAGAGQGAEPGAGAPNAGAKAPDVASQGPGTEELLQQMETFQPETDNEGFLRNVAKAALTEVLSARQRLEDLDGRVKRHDEDSETRATADADGAIDRAKAGLKEKYGDLCDGGKREDEWEGLAARLRNAAALDNQPMTLDEALEQAAQLLLRDKIAGNAVKTVKDAAARAAAAGTETPGRGTGPEELSLEQRLGKAYDGAHGRT